MVPPLALVYPPTRLILLELSAVSVAPPMMLNAVVPLELIQYPHSLWTLTPLLALSARFALGSRTYTQSPAALLITPAVAVAATVVLLRPAITARNVSGTCSEVCAVT